MTPSPSELAQRIAADRQKLSALQADVCRLVDQIDRWNGRSGAIQPPEQFPSLQADADAALDRLSAQIADLSGAVRQLESRLRGLEDLSLVAPRKPMRIRVVEWLVGREYHRAWWQKAAVPAVTAVVPAGDDRATAQTVQSVLRHAKAGWDVLVVGPEPGPLLQRALDAGAGRARHILVNGPVWERLDKGLGDASKSGISTVIGILHPGQQLEPTADDAVMQFFRDHPRTMVANFQRTVRQGPWRMPIPRQRPMDVYALLAQPGTDGWGHGGVFFRRRALGMVGGYKPAMRSAAEWHLYLRLARMFGMRRAPGQAVSITAEEAVQERCGEYLEFEQARQEFLGNFGPPGRARCRAVYLLHGLQHAMETKEHHANFPGPRTGEEPELIGEELADRPREAGKVDRLLFAMPDAIGRPCFAYRCAGEIGAVVLPMPGAGGTGAREANAATTAPPAYHGGSGWVRWLTDQTPPGSAVGGGNEEELVAMLLAHVSSDDDRIRLLAPADARGADLLAARTRWLFTRLPADCPLDEAALRIPQADRFDVVWAGAAIRESADPAGVLRSLVSVLAPRGIVAFAVPNLDSRLRDRFGPTWAGWNAARHRLIPSRRGIRQVARLSDLRLRRHRSRTDLPGVLRSVSLNAPGEPNAGVAQRLTRWARILWDWRGRGDEWLVLLQAE